MRTWIRFFVGTPRRFVTTVGVCALTVVVLSREIQEALFTRLQEIARSLGPLVEHVAVLAILLFIPYAICRRVLYSLLGGGGNKH